MSEEIAISVEHVSKAYRIWESPSARLMSPLQEGLSGLLPKKSNPAQYLRNKAAKHYKDFYALRDISFILKRGESAGIIGRNGSGKSTLLQIIAGTLQPTEGSVKVNGRVAALLELGAGFNPEFTGRENVHLSAAVLGISRQEIEQRFDEIEAFADIGDFLDQAIKTYSSGMTMRLAFAVNTCVDPDILIVDEALSVGDAPFQAKCFRRLRQLIDNGVSLLFVSHDIGTVRSICNCALWLKGGRAEMWGEAKKTAREYEKFCWQEQGIPFAPQIPQEVAPIPSPPPLTPIEKILVNTADDFAARTLDGRIGTGAVRFTNCILISAEGTPLQRIAFNQEAIWNFGLIATQSIDTDIVLGLAIFDVKGNRIAGVQNIDKSLRLVLRAGASTRGLLKMRFPFTAEKYSIRLTLLGFKDGLRLVNGVYDFNRSIILDQVTDAAFFEVDFHAIFPIAPPVCLTGEISIEAPPV